MGLSLDDRPLDYAELAAAKGELVASELLARLSDGRATVRANALLGLAAIGHTGRELVPFLRDADLRVARAAAEALAELGIAQRANLIAIAAALDGARPDVREAILRMFSQLVGPADQELVDVLDTGSEVVANAVVQACARVGTRGLHLLQRAARDERVRVRINAVRGVAQLGEVELESSMDVLVGVERDDRVSDVRATARAAMSTLRARTRAAQSARHRMAEPVPSAVPELEQRALTAAEVKSAATVASLDELLRALESTRVHVRINAIRVLAVRGAPAAATVRALAVRLRDADDTVRVEVALALGTLGAAAVIAAPELVRALGDDETAVIAAAETALASFGDAAAPVLVDGLDTPHEPRGVRVAALLARVADGPRLLREALASTSVDVRVHAAQALGALGAARAGATAVAALGVAAVGGNARLRGVVATAIARLAPKPDRAPRLAIAGFEDRALAEAELAAAAAKAVLVAVGAGGIAAHLSDARPVVRANAATALGTLGADALAVVDTLAVSLRDDDADVRLAAARAIDRIGDAAVIAAAPDLVRALRDADAPLAAQLATMLRGRAQPAISDALARGLATTDARHAQRIGELVCARPGALDVLLDAFQRPPSSANAARGLVLLGKDRLGTGRALLDHARSTGTAPMRELARATLREIDGVPSAPELPAIAGFETAVLDAVALAKHREQLDPRVLASFLHDGRPVVRANTVTALGALGPSVAAFGTAIAALLRDDDDRVRIAAAGALDKLGDDAVIATAPALIAALRGGLPVATACRAVLAARKGKVEAALLAGLETFDEAHGLRIVELIVALPNARALLFEAFDGPAQNVQINAAYGIGLLGSKLAGPAGRRRLVAGLAGPFTRRREAMVKALALLGPES